MRITRLIIFYLATMILYLIAMLGMFISFSYTKGWILADFEFVDAKEAIAIIAKEKDILILDVRTLIEYKNKHLVNATHIPVQVLRENLSLLEDHNGERIIVYCRSGVRSIKASRILEEHGFRPVNVEGGLNDLIRNDAKTTR